MRVPAIGSLWLNNKRGFTYEVERLFKASDFEDEEGNLELWVVLVNIETGEAYGRSLTSFWGRNSNGDPRFAPC